MRISDGSSVVCSSDLMAGLQGAGKTTTAGKLARFLKERKKKSVMVVSADIYRPAAIKQLETLANDIGVTFFPSDLSQKPVDIAQAAIKEAKLKFIDVVIVDTAGRLHIDEEMMRSEEHTSELQSIMRHSYAVFCLK